MVFQLYHLAGADHQKVEDLDKVRLRVRIVKAKTAGQTENLYSTQIYGFR